jgi:hypothetical protein
LGFAVVKFAKIPPIRSFRPSYLKKGLIQAIWRRLTGAAFFRKPSGQAESGGLCDESVLSEPSRSAQINNLTLPYSRTGVFKNCQIWFAADSRASKCLLLSDLSQLETRDWVF